MVYVRVKEETQDILRLSREPSLRAWAISVGLISLGIGAAIYSADYLLWKIAYISSSIFVAVSFMEEWEECLLDKKSGQIHFKAETLLGKILQLSQGRRSVVGEIDEVVGVAVEAEDVKYGGTAYTVILKFAAGYSIGVTETATTGNRSGHEQIAEKISKFLELDKKATSSTQGNICLSKEDLENPSTEEEDLSEGEGEKTADESNHSDASFERINKSDIPDDISEAVAATAEEQASSEASMSEEISSTTHGGSQ